MIRKLIHKLLNIHPDAMSFQQGLDLTGLPIITLYQGEQKLNFILDTGSMDCVLDESALKLIDSEIATDENGKDKKVELSGMEGISELVYVHRIQLHYKDKKFDCECLVKDLSGPFESIKREKGVILHGFLGSNFFDTYKYVIDFKELIAYSKL